MQLVPRHRKTYRTEKVAITEVARREIMIVLDRTNLPPDKEMEAAVLQDRMHLQRETAVREDREMETVVLRDREMEAAAPLDREKAMHAVRDKEITVRVNSQDLRGSQARVVLREEMDRVVRIPEEVKTVMAVQAARVVRDSARIPEKMMIWYLHRS